MSSAEQSRTGVFETSAAKGQGYLRDPARNYKVQPDDPFIDNQLWSKYSLRPGATLTVRVEPSKGSRTPKILEITAIEGRLPEDYQELRAFDDLTPIDPRDRLKLETGPEPMGPRVMDLLTPIGKGQRGLIVAPPRSGKTILMQQIANAVAINHPETKLIVLLVDERPEEVTEMRRSVKGEVVASSSDHPPEEHIRLTQLTFDRARRITETGGQVLILMDSLTRLARSYNKNSNSGRTMSGGVDIKALDVPKRLFGAARAFDEGGSLTVLATCLVETGSRMDDLIFQEFKGTGNMEVVLDRKLSERRVWPAIDIQLSGTRKEERLLDAETFSRVTLLRRSLSTMKPVEAMESLVKQMGKFPSNSEFLDRIGQFQN